MQTQTTGINDTLIKRLLTVVDAGLVKGVGRPEPGLMCVEAAVCFTLGLPHGDDPKCVSRAVRAFKIALNDSPWSSDAARAKGLRRLAVAQLGSDTIDDAIFAKEVALAAVRKIVPIALRHAAAVQIKEIHRTALEKAADRCVAINDLKSAESAAKSAESAAWSAAWSAAKSAAESAAWSAAESAAESAAWSAARDEVLTIMAGAGVEALKVAQSPGCAFLHLCDQ